MNSIRCDAVINDDHTLQLTLPDLPPGQVKVVIYPKEKPVSEMTDNEVFAELMNFHKGNYLNNITLQELRDEGRK